MTSADEHTPAAPSGAHTAPPVATGYAAAQQELESILTELERADVDVDRLAAQVQRAAALIAFCRERIQHARVQIDQVVGRLDDELS